MLSEPRAEELIRAALAVQADRAVESAEVLAGLDPAGRRRHRGAALTAVAAVVAAVAIPLGLHWDRPAPPASLPDPASAPATSVATPYQVGWVPSGYVADERSASRDGSLYESQWHPLPYDSQDVIQLVAAAGTPATPCAASPEAVSVGTAAGQYRVCSVKTMGAQYVWIAQVQWSPRAGWYLTLAVWQHTMSATPDRAMVLRAAGSVAADPTARLDLPLTVGHVPPGFAAADDFGVGQLVSPPGWIGSWGLPIIPFGTRAAADPAPRTSVVVDWGPSSTGPGARPACIPGSCEVFVQVHGWWLMVDLSGPGVTLQQARAVADSVTVRPGVTYPWLGRP